MIGHPDGDVKHDAVFIYWTLTSWIVYTSPEHTLVATHTTHFAKATTPANMGKDHPDANLHPEATGLAAKTVRVSIVDAPLDTAD
jgi:hypothetical protein